MEMNGNEKSSKLYVRAAQAEQEFEQSYLWELYVNWNSVYLVGHKNVMSRPVSWNVREL